MLPIGIGPGPQINNLGTSAFFWSGDFSFPISEIHAKFLLLTKASNAAAGSDRDAPRAGRASPGEGGRHERDRMPVSKKPRRKAASTLPQPKTKTAVAGGALPDRRAMESYLAAIGRPQPR